MSFSRKATCFTCPYWNEVSADDLFTAHTCRRHSPQIGQYGQQWASTQPEDWCGDHPDFSALAIAQGAAPAGGANPEEKL